MGALPSHFIAYKVAELFVNMVWKLHGLPKRIVSDRDPIFFSKLWTDLFKFIGTLLRMSSSYHPQTDKLNSRIWVRNYRKLLFILKSFMQSHRPFSSGVNTSWDISVLFGQAIKALRSCYNRLFKHRISRPMCGNYWVFNFVLSTNQELPTKLLMLYHTCLQSGLPKITLRKIALVFRHEEALYFTLLDSAIHKHLIYIVAGIKKLYTLLC